MDNFIQLLFKYKWSIFARGQFGFANFPAWWLIGIGVVGVGLLIYFLYVRPGYRINLNTRWGLIALRGSLLALIFILLMRPVVVIPSIIPKSTSVAVLADDSRSMQLADDRNRTRIQNVKEDLAPKNRFAGELNDTFKVNLYGLLTNTGKIINSKGHTPQ